MTKLKTSEIIQKAIKIAKADSHRREFTRRDKSGKSLFAMVPYTLIFNKCVTTMDIRVYAVIRGYCQRKGEDSIRVSQRKIANILETNRRVITRSIQLLESLDWLEVERHFKSNSTYTPRISETCKAQEIRSSEAKPRKEKESGRIRELFLKQLAESEKTKMEFLEWFKSLPKKEAEEFYEKHSDFVDHITK